MATNNFTDPKISFSDAGLLGEKNLFPTAIEFARSGEPVLFVAQQDGAIFRYVVERQGDGFAVSKAATPSQTAPATLKIDAIQKGVANYDDDGTPVALGKRQVTGLAVREETIDGVARDVLYVSSSDNRIGGGSDADFENIDSNSSQIHKLVLDQSSGAVIDSVALVRGLPRSAENHSANGIDFGIDPETGDTIMYFAQGANTNKGAPSNNFVGFVDTALTGAVIAVNLTELSRYDVRTDGAGERFVLDLPTLNDPERADLDLAALGIENLKADPNFALDDNGVGANGELIPDWAGGAQGINQAKITSHVLVSEGGQLKLVETPLTVVQPGHRNAYDVLVTAGGEVVTWDNGPNGGWGGVPKSFQDGQNVDHWEEDLATNDFNESGSSAYWDQLHVVGRVGEEAGPYAGFPNAIRAAKEVLERSFAPDGSYLGATPDAQIVDDDGVVIFRDEGEARDFLARLLPVYKVVDGVWTDVRPRDAEGRPILPADLHDIVSGYEWAHPGSGIADPKKHFSGPSIMDGTVFSPEGQEMPWGQDGGLILGSGSTNGLAEYTAGSWFGGALEGAVVATGWGGGKMLFTELVDTDGDGRTDKAVKLGSIAGFGSKPLDVTTLGDAGLGRFVDNDGDGIDDFAGVIVAVTYGNHSVTTFTPGGTPSGPNIDQDLDGLDDTRDTHVGDPLDGRSVLAGEAPLRWDFVLSDPSSTPPGAATTAGPAGGIGIHSAFSNGVDFARDGGIYDDSNWDLGGASTFASSEAAHSGSPDGETNSLRNVLGLGATLAQGLASATITTEMVNVFDYVLNEDQGATWTGGEEVGLVLGPDQSDFVRAVIVMRPDGTAGLRLSAEEGDVELGGEFQLMPGVERPADIPNQSSSIQMGFVLDLTPGAETVAARARYQNPDLDQTIGPDAEWSEWFQTDAVALPAAVLESLRGEHEHLGRQTGAVIGLYSRAKPGDDSFAASWDWVEIDGTMAEGGGEQVVYRWNAGRPGATVEATDGGPDWLSDPAAVASGSTNRFGYWNLAERDATLPAHVPTALFAQERWDEPGGGDLGLSFGAEVLGAALPDGQYTVRVFLGDGWSGSAEPGQRVFDVLVEGQTAAEDLDLAARFGHGEGGMIEWTGRVSDGAVDVAFGREVQSPLVNGVEIVAMGDAPAPPRVSVLGGTLAEAAGPTGVTVQTDRPVPVGQTVQVGWEVRGLDGGAVPGTDYEVPDAALSGGVYSGTGSIAGGSSDLVIPVVVLDDGAVEGPEAFEVVLTSVAGAGATIGTGAAKLSIVDDDEAVGSDEPVHRIDAGGPGVAAEGLDWGGDSGSASSGRTVDYGGFSGQNNTGAPSAVFATERYGHGSGPLSYALDVAEGTYEVELYFAETWSKGQSAGARVFDVAAEGRTVLDDFDITATYGWNVAGSETFEVAVADGTLNLDLLRGVQNPKINAIEVRRIEDGGSGGGTGGGGGGDGGPATPADLAPGFAGTDFSEDGASPTATALAAGSNAVRATQSGEPRNYDFLTFTVPDGHHLTAMTVLGYDDHDASVNNGTFVGLAEGATFPIDFADGAPDSTALMGGAVYALSAVGKDLLPEMADGIVQGGGNAPTQGFSGTVGAGTYTLGWSQNQGMTTTDLNLQVDPMTDEPMGAAQLTITPDDGIQRSNFKPGSFSVKNTGDKDIAWIKVDVSEALYPDSVFDPFGKAGDSIAKALTIDAAGGTGAKLPAQPYGGPGGEAGYETVRLNFDDGVSGGFGKGETVTFSVDMDPNSVAGSTKGPLDAGSSPRWDVGGVSGAELIGSRFRVAFEDGTKAEGRLMGDGSQSGAVALAKQKPLKEGVVLKADGYGPGEVGEYGDGGPAVTIQGQSGETARVVLTKGFIQPVTNEFSGAYKSQLDAQLAALAASGFPANNAVEFQTVDVALDGSVQDISALFDFDDVDGVSLSSEDDLPLGLVAAVIDGKGRARSETTDPIYLAHDEDAGGGSSGGGGGGGSGGGGGTGGGSSGGGGGSGGGSGGGGAGSQTIVVHAGGDVNGSTKPQFSLIVDGKTIGGPRTVSNADADPGSVKLAPYSFTFDGPAPETVEVRFLNDSARSPYGPGNDVNLHIDRIVVNGTTYQAEADGVVRSDNQRYAERFGWDGQREDMRGEGVMTFEVDGGGSGGSTGGGGGSTGGSGSGGGNSGGGSTGGGGGSGGGTHTVTVVADGTVLLKGGGTVVKPEFQLVVDGKKVGPVTEVSNADASAFDRDFEAFRFEVEGARPDTVEVEFLNDAGVKPWGPGQDVNLFVDRIEVDDFVFEAEADGVVTGSRWSGAREDMRADSVMTFDDLSYA